MDGGVFGALIYACEVRATRGRNVVAQFFAPFGARVGTVALRKCGVREGDF